MVISCFSVVPGDERQPKWDLRKEPLRNVETSFIYFWIGSDRTLAQSKMRSHHS